MFDDNQIPSIEESKKLLSQHMKKVSPRVAMAVFARGKEANSVDNNGTASLLNLNNNKLIITNHHVWNHFCSEKENDQRYRIALTGTGIVQPIDISEATVISENQQHDLCVLSYPPERLENIGKQYLIPDRWPPKRAIVGDKIAIAGFPGIRRTVDPISHPETGEIINALRHELILIYLDVEAVSNSQLRLKFNSKNPEAISLTDRPIEQLLWGGMSGSLVYRLDFEMQKFLPCAILSGAGEGHNAIFYATHLDFIESNGTINTS